MKTNNILGFSAVFFKFLLVTAFLFVILVTVVLIHSEIDPASYNGVILKIDRGLELSNSSAKSLPPVSYAEYIKTKNETIYFSKLNLGSKVTIWFFVVISLALCNLILKELIRFIQSTKRYSSFFTENSIAFKKMSTYMGAFLVLDIILNFWSFNIKMIFPDGIVQRHSSQYINLSSIILICSLWLLFLILSQVFKEGERVKQENELTI
jgi:hypothetical protein